ncbi:MAG: universal stress protein [Candidatus Electrothrix sp. AR4]|nr:universal stress protein [Candidatus Electrothrix sp. AR4]
MNKKILVAVDGSVYSSNSLDYLIRLFRQERNFNIDLIGAVSIGSGEQGWMMEIDPPHADISAVQRRKKRTESYLKDARARLVRNGFPEEHVNFFVQAKGAAVTNSIYSFAEKGVYDGLLVGRRGVGKVGEIFMGSVSADLVRKCHEVPVWIIDGNVTSTRFLLAAHSSPCSLMAADHLAYILTDNPKTEICIYHSSSVFGSTPPAEAEEFHSQWGEAWCEKYLDLDSCLYEAHTRVLLENGISEQQIVHISPHRDLDASHDLLRQAKKHNCGTIVIGRRGRKAEKGILGGVSDRTTQHAQNMAVWLVG